MLTWVKDSFSFLLISITQEGDCVNEAIASLPTAQPCLIVIGGLSSIQNALLVVEKKAVTNFPPNQALVILLGAFYAYNMHYPEGCKNIYTFFEVVFFKYKRPAKKTRLAAILAKLTYC